jgi:hypothetical protein
MGRWFAVSRAITSRSERRPTNADCKAVLDSWPRAKIHTKTLAASWNDLEFRAYDQAVTSHEVGTRLAGFDVHPEPRPFRLAGSKPQRGFLVRGRGHPRQLPTSPEARIQRA